MDLGNALSLAFALPVAIFDLAGVAGALEVRPAEGGPARVLRINGLDTPAGLADLAALLGSPASPDFLLLPKTDSAAHLQILDRLLTGAKRDTRLIGIIESARSLASVEKIATATPRLAALAVGADGARPRDRDRSHSIGS